MTTEFDHVAMLSLLRDGYNDNNDPFTLRRLALDAAISALQAQQQGAQAVAWALEQGGILADWCNTAGDALRSLMGAYERRVRSACTSSADLDARPWRCAEYVHAEDALATKPTPSVLVGNGKSDTHPQPLSTPKPSAQASA